MQRRQADNSSLIVQNVSVDSSATCRNLVVDANAYLVWALTRLGPHRDVFGLTAVEVTPAVFKRERDRQ